MVKNIKGNILVRNEQIAKKKQLEILELKNVITETKIHRIGLTEILRMTEE